MCKMATDAGFTVVDQYIWRYDLEHDHFLTNEIKNELRDRSVIYTETEGMTNGNYYRYSDMKLITLSNTKGEFLNGQCSPKSLLNFY